MPKAKHRDSDPKQPRLSFVQGALTCTTPTPPAAEPPLEAAPVTAEQAKGVSSNVLDVGYPIDPRDPLGSSAAAAGDKRHPPQSGEVELPPPRKNKSKKVFKPWLINLGVVLNAPNLPQHYRNQLEMLFALNTTLSSQLKEELSKSPTVGISFDESTDCSTHSNCVTCVTQWSCHQALGTPGT